MRQSVLVNGHNSSQTNGESGLTEVTGACARLREGVP